MASILSLAKIGQFTGNHNAFEQELQKLPASRENDPSWQAVSLVDEMATEAADDTFI
jgi:hypothetical protein